MYRIDLTKYNEYADLPLDQFRPINTYSIYALDHNWNYLFINEFVHTNLGARADNLIGKNMWTEFPELAVHPAFISLRENSEKGIATNVRINSPLTHQQLNVIGKPLKDCYFFYSTVMPDKEELMRELRGELNKR